MNIGPFLRICNFFRDRNELVTLNKLQTRLKENEINISKTTLWRFLQENPIEPYGWKNRNIQVFVKQKPQIQTKLHKYLRILFENRSKPIDQQYQEVYLDETYCDAHHTLSKTWIPLKFNPYIDLAQIGGQHKMPPDRPSGAGQRLVILAAGTRDGFIPNTNLIFRANGSGDYHSNMNAEIFENWFKNTLLPALDRPSYIILDNASYHSRKQEKYPTTQSKKGEIISFLQKHQIEFTNFSNKVDLLKIAKIHADLFPNSYTIDEIALEHGHMVLRLPPYHSELNPIELIWGQIKHFVARENKTYKIGGVAELVEYAMDNIISSEQGQGAIHHVLSFENQS